jgi:hypothetical protein
MDQDVDRGFRDALIKAQQSLATGAVSTWPMAYGGAGNAGESSTITRADRPSRR